MTTYYVSKAGNDATAAADDITKPYLTMAGAIGGPSTNGDTIEIIDEGAYNEGDIAIFSSNYTITHTASHLERPKIHGTGLAGASGQFAFYIYSAFVTYNHIEFYDYSYYTIKKGATAYGKFHMSGCFVHDSPQAFSHTLAGDTSTKSTINDCVIFLENAGSTGISFSSDITINNCLITSSNSQADPFIFGGHDTVTASFCTVLNRGNPTSQFPVIVLGKAINCIVSGSGGNNSGIASDNHTYNLVNVGGTSFRDMSDSGDGSPATGDIVETNALFVNETSMGASPEIAASFKLQSGSPCIDAGISYGGINTDISGTARPQGAAPDIGCFEFASGPPVDPTWAPYGTQSYPAFGGDFTINRSLSLTANYKLPADNSPNQVPFSLTIPGPPTIRSRSKAYILARSNPDKVLSGSS